jgi:hypothetical protein
VRIFGAFAGIGKTLIRNAIHELYRLSQRARFCSYLRQSIGRTKDALYGHDVHCESVVKIAEFASLQSGETDVQTYTGVTGAKTTTLRLRFGSRLLNGVQQAGKVVHNCYHSQKRTQWSSVALEPPDYFSVFAHFSASSSRCLLDPGSFRLQ